MNEFTLLDSPEIRDIHLIGIGGTSMSGLAAILANMGYTITGSDMKYSKAIEKLQKMGMKVFIGHSPDNIANPDLVVYTAAVSKDNPELLKASELGIPVIERSTLLGLIMKKHLKSIAVSGTHGKTSTTSMVALIMLEEGLDPSVHIGGEVDAIGGGIKIGGSEYFVTEACEYVDSFLKLYPYIAIILNIDADHLDYFKDINQIKKSFNKFATQVQKDGYIIACADDRNTMDALSAIPRNIITYGLTAEDAIWKAADIEFDTDGKPSYTLILNGIKQGIVKLNVPGIHNVSNSLAAAAACSVAGCSIDSIIRGLLSYTGAHKRFELKGIQNNIKVIDDYAHHPSEVKATLKAARNSCRSKIWCVFQPHTYSRVKNLIDEFASSFFDADKVIVTDIYAAREVDTGEVHARMLAERLKSKNKDSVYISDFKSIADYLGAKALPGDMIITMGAGDVCKVGELFLQNNIR